MRSQGWILIGVTSAGSSCGCLCHPWEYLSAHQCPAFSSTPPPSLGRNLMRPSQRSPTHVVPSLRLDHEPSELSSAPKSRPACVSVECRCTSCLVEHIMWKRESTKQVQSEVPQRGSERDTEGRGGQMSVQKLSWNLYVLHHQCPSPPSHPQIAHPRPH